MVLAKVGWTSLLQHCAMPGSGHGATVLFCKISFNFKLLNALVRRRWADVILFPHLRQYPGVRHNLK